MKSALLSKIAMCVCPPAVVATSAITIPPVKRAVHRLTAPQQAVARPKPHRAFSAAYDCTPAAVPITNLAPLGNGVVAPAEPVANAVIVPAQSGAPVLAQPIAFPIAGAVTPIFPIGIANPPVTSPGGSALPETSTWIMTIGGFGAIGWALRRKRVVKARGSTETA